MPSKKPTANLTGLVATKGSAAPSSTPARAAASPRKSEEPLMTLNFRVPASFRKRFRGIAYVEDLRLNELLYRMADEYERAHNIHLPG